MSNDKPPVEYCETTGKVAYDKRGAQTAANKRMKEGGQTLRVYECEFCALWHLTSARKQRARDRFW